MNGIEAKITTIPDCDFCGNGTMASYDGRTTIGPWANMCQAHFDRYGVGLGLGKGQKLVLEK